MTSYKRLYVFCSALALIGTIYCKMGNITDAVKHLEQSIEFGEQKKLPLCRATSQCMQ